MHKLRPLSLCFFSQWWKAFWCISTDDKLLLQIKKKNLLLIFREMSAWHSDERLDLGDSDNAENVSRRARGLQPDR